MHIYFSGIGGVGLGPLALLVRKAGQTISGSDQHASPTFIDLKNQGFNVSLDQTNRHLAQTHQKNPVDWFVYSSAITDTHPELVYAKAHSIKISKRSELIKKIIEDRDLRLIAIAGTHGKTTTTAMVVWLFKKLNLPLSYLIGAPLSWASSGDFESSSRYFIYECDEFDRNFLDFKPYLSLITSIGYDHPDSYPDQASYNQAFEQFQNQSQYVLRWDNVPIQPLSLKGEHNRRNGSLAIAGLQQLTDQPAKKLVQLLDSFIGSSRRFEKLADNLYSDYAHHPDEIAATLQMAREINRHVVIIYQPHQNLRQPIIKKGYSTCFDLAQKIYWLPTYLSREDEKMPIISPIELTKTIDSDKLVFSEFGDELWTAIQTEREKNNLVIIMGAGTIDAWARGKLKSCS